MRDMSTLAFLRRYSRAATKNTFKRAGVLLLISLAILFSFTQPIFAHPADQAYVVATFDATPDELRIHVRLQLGPLLAAPLWAEADRDQNGQMDAAEITAWLPQFTERNFVIQVDDARVPLTAQVNHLGNFSAFHSVTAQPQIELTLHSPIAAGQHVVMFAHKLTNNQGGFRADVQSTAHAAFGSVAIDGARATATLDTALLQPSPLLQRLLVWLGLSGVLAAVVSGAKPALNSAVASANKQRVRWLASGAHTRIASILLALITLFTTSNPVALPSLRLAAIGGCEVIPSAIWLKSAIAGGAPQQTVQVILPPSKATTFLISLASADSNTLSTSASVNGTTARTAQAQVLADGKLSLLVAVPPTTGAPVPRTISVNTLYGNCTQTVLVPQATQWNIYISQFGHPDAGWCAGNTYAQERQRQVNNQVAALDQISATLTRTLDNRQRFEADDFWQFDEALKDNPARAAQFQQYIQQGYYGLNPTYAPLLVQALDSESYLQGMLPYAARERAWNLPKRTSAFLSEIPESTAGMPTLLNHAGITSFARGVLYSGLWGGAMPTEIEARRLFWWQGPDGSKVLARMQADGTYFELLANTYSEFANTLNSKALAYDNAKTAGNYPADAFLLFGTLFDCGNVDANYKLGDFIEQWNNSVAYPHIAGGNQNEFFEYVAQNFGSQLQTYSGGFDTQWTDGLAYHANSTTQFRNNAAGLQTAEKLAAIALAPGSGSYTPNPSVWLDALKDHMLYAEHSTLSNGSACFSCTLQQNLEQHRAQLVRDVFTRTQSILTGALSAITPNISTGAASSTQSNPYVSVFNPLSWERSAPVTVTVNSTVALYLTDLTTGNTVPGQLVAPNTLLFVAPNVPALGYKVFRLEGEQGSVAVPFSTTSNLIASSRFSITVDEATGGVSIYDKFLSRDLIGGASGRMANQLVYNYSGTLQSNINVAANTQAGPVAARIKITGKPSAGNITAFTQTVTLMDGLPFVMFENELDKTVSNPNCTGNCALERLYFAYPISLTQAITPQMRVESNGGITNIGTDIFAGAVRDYYGVQSFANVSDNSASVTVAMPDTTLVEFGGPRTHQKNATQPASSEMLALAHLNDVDASRQNALAGRMAFSFALAAHGNAFDALQSVRFGWEQRTPVVISRLPANQPGALPGTSRSYGQISAGNAVLSALKPADDGNGYIARFWNPSPTAQHVEFDLSLLGVTQAQYVDGLERPLATGGTAFAFSGAGSVDVAAQGFVTLRLIRNPAPPLPSPTPTPTTTATAPVQSTPTPLPTATPTDVLATATRVSPTPNALPTAPSPPTPPVAAPTPTRPPVGDRYHRFVPFVLKNTDGTEVPRFAAVTVVGVPTVNSAGATATEAIARPTATAPAASPLATPTLLATPTPQPTVTVIPTQPPPPTQVPPTAIPTARPLTVLDNFDRPDGAVGDSWSGFTSRFVITGSQLAQTFAAIDTNKPSIMFFNKPLTTLTTTQEIGLKMGVLGGDDLEGEIALLLKWQGPASEIDCNAVEVKYELKAKRVSVNICDPGTGGTWESRGGSKAVYLKSGDFFSARIDEAGNVKVFQNGNLVHTANVKEWEFNPNPGQPGFRLEDVPGTTVDNFSAE